MPAVSDLPYLLRLLDDDDPEVVEVLRVQFEAWEGDISDEIAALGCPLTASGRRRLSAWLQPGRRQSLVRDWVVPSGGARALGDDWDAFECLLGVLSDFLHDGVSLRPALADQLDLLGGEVAARFEVPTAELLSEWMFEQGRFRKASKKRNELAGFDLCEVIEEGRGTPTSLGCLYMLVGRRLGMEIHGCNFPGHFLCRYEGEEGVRLVDCYHRGRSFSLDELMMGDFDISQRARNALSSPCYLGEVLMRYLRELFYVFGGQGRTEDAGLMKQLSMTLQA